VIIARKTKTTDARIIAASLAFPQSGAQFPLETPGMNFVLFD